MSATAAQQGRQGQPAGPPYPPPGAALGGVPTTGVDVPISAVVILLFAVSAGLHMTVFQRNRRRGHKFVPSAVVFGFSMARIAANAMRIAWATHPHNVSVAIAASVLANAGVILLFIVGLVLAQRLVRAYQPRLGWSPLARCAFGLFFGLVVACLVMLIIAVVYAFYTLDGPTRARLRRLQLFAITLLAVLAFLPLPLVGLALLLPRRQPVDAFGSGRMRTKTLILVFVTLLLALGAGFRAGVAYVQRPADRPAWFHHKACYYCFNYVIELIVVFTYGLSRFDRRFHVPDACTKPGDYSREPPTETKAAAFNEHSPHTLARQQQQESEWEASLQEGLIERRLAS